MRLFFKSPFNRSMCENLNDLRFSLSDSRCKKNMWRASIENLVKYIMTYILGKHENRYSMIVIVNALRLLILLSCLLSVSPIAIILVHRCSILFGSLKNLLCLPWLLYINLFCHYICHHLLDKQYCSLISFAFLISLIICARGMWEVYCHIASKVFEKQEHKQLWT